jgi:hypothetical protein
VKVPLPLTAMPALSLMRLIVPSMLLTLVEVRPPPLRLMPDVARIDPLLTGILLSITLLRLRVPAVIVVAPV